MLTVLGAGLMRTNGRQRPIMIELDGQLIKSQVFASEAEQPAEVSIRVREVCVMMAPGEGASHGNVGRDFRNCADRIWCAGRRRLDVWWVNNILPGRCTCKASGPPLSCHSGTGLTPTRRGLSSHG
jgi:hypothetical protein